MPTRPLVLVLGGTAEARAVAGALAANDTVRVLTALAGRTAAPAALPGAVRVGGFGGAEGLAAFLRAEGVAAVIDATHTFAATISANAVQACAVTGVSRLAVVRPAWSAQPGDHWHDVADAAEAAALLPRLGRRALLTIGGGDLIAFSDVTGVHMVVRAVDAPRDLPPGATLILARGPFDLATETALLADHEIDVMVSKDSGGATLAPKLVAARQAGIPVVILRRPPSPPGDVVADAAAACDWVARVVGAIAP